MIKLEVKGKVGISLRACANALGLSHVGLLEAVNTGRAPRNPDGSFDLAAVTASDWWRSRAEVQAARAASLPSQTAEKSTYDKLVDLPKIQVDKLILLERRKKLKLANDREEKITINAMDAALAWGDCGRRIADAVIGLPARIVNRLPAEWRHEVLAAAEEETRRTLTALSDEIRCDPAAA